MSVVRLETSTRPTLPIDVDLIADLELLLEKAKQGEIQGYAFITIKSSGAGNYIDITNGFCGAAINNNVHTAIGALAILQARLISEKNGY